MLRDLEVRDILLIDELALAFQPGLNVLTGETGAGKSILLDALGFVLGWRGRAELVRSGAETGEVIAVFDLPSDHPAQGVLKTAGWAPVEELVLRRTNSKDGRKTAFINDRRCSGDLLRTLSATLVELHGQHDDRGLLDRKGHRRLLDTFCALDLSSLGGAWTDLVAARKAVTAFRERLTKATEEQDFLSHSVTELDRLSPLVGEEEELDTRRRLMQASGRIREDIARAAHVLGAEGAEGAVLDASRWLEDSLEHADGRLDVTIAALQRASEELANATSGIEDFLDHLDFDPLELERVEERLFAIRGLARKHNVPADDLPAFTEKLRAQLDEIEAGDEEMDRLKDALVQAETQYGTLAESVSGKRQEAAVELEVAMGKELAPLKLDRAEFRVVLRDAPPGPSGIDDVAFEVATNPGAPSGPIEKIASGGELSRFLLALKVCLTSSADGLTLIFDEIDRGVGGATADAVGRRLKSLADGSQVLVVTHSPQVAALGRAQWQVAKSVEGDETFSKVQRLDELERVYEIARMLSGDQVTEEAKAAAEALLNNA
ncbi:MAG: DNA repair protein RecN [Pseudomonadota bacterium]